MKYLPYITGFMGLFYFVVETLRRGIGYFSINASTMLEDYLCGLVLLTASLMWLRSHVFAPIMMVGAWAYATGGMFVPFTAHFEAWLRGVTFRPDHPHDEIGVIVLKGVIMLISLICLFVSFRSASGLDNRR